MHCRVLVSPRHPHVIQCCTQPQKRPESLQPFRRSPPTSRLHVATQIPKQRSAAARATAAARASGCSRDRDLCDRKDCVLALLGLKNMDTSINAERHVWSFDSGIYMGSVVRVVHDRCTYSTVIVCSCIHSRRSMNSLTYTVHLADDQAQRVYILAATR